MATRWQLLRPGATLALFAMYTAEAAQEMYTNNLICLQKNCINPLFPASAAMADEEQQSFECQTDSYTSRNYLDFCHAAINYEFALPQAKGEQKMPDVAKIQEQKAATYYHYHVAGMGFEFWENNEPWKGEDECLKAVWQLTCYTFFPACNKQSGQENFYLRPCRSSCEAYSRACKVECCDESVSCVYELEDLHVDGSVSKQTGYVDHNGPSALCTGNAERIAPFSVLVLAVVLITTVLS